MSLLTEEEVKSTSSKDGGGVDQEDKSDDIGDDDDDLAAPPVGNTEGESELKLSKTEIASAKGASYLLRNLFANRCRHRITNLLP